jgi:hypothetical protein
MSRKRKKEKRTKGSVSCSTEQQQKKKKEKRTWRTGWSDLVRAHDQPNTKEQTRKILEGQSEEPSRKINLWDEQSQN